jgi:hypothetical protein
MNTDLVLSDSVEIRADPWWVVSVLFRSAPLRLRGEAYFPMIWNHRTIDSTPQ